MLTVCKSKHFKITQTPFILIIYKHNIHNCQKLNINLELDISLHNIMFHIVKALNLKYDMSVKNNGGNAGQVEN